MVHLIPARYIGGHAVLLAEHQGDHYDAAGNVLTSNLISPGDTLMMPETEVLGETLYEDTPGSGRFRSLGAGRIRLPEHENRPDEDLVGLGYMFYSGRPDFDPITIVDAAPVEEPDMLSKPAKAGKAPAHDAAE